MIFLQFFSSQKIPRTFKKTMETILPFLSLTNSPQKSFACYFNKPQNIKHKFCNTIVPIFKLKYLYPVILNITRFLWKSTFQYFHRLYNVEFCNINAFIFDTLNINQLYHIIGSLIHNACINKVWSMILYFYALNTITQYSCKYNNKVRYIY